MLSERRICFLGGRLNAGRPLEGLRTWPPHGEPEFLFAAPTEGRRGGGSMEKESFSAMGLSLRLGVDELLRLDCATFPKRKGGREFSALLGR